MATRTEIALKYDKQYEDLGNEFFETVNKGTSKQERRLKIGKSAADFNLRNTKITERYEAELANEGFAGLTPIIEKPRDYNTEIDNLTARVEKLEKK